MTTRHRAIIIAAACAAGLGCGQGEPPTSTRGASARPIVPVADARGDPVVAVVDGVPVLASCVIDQAAANASSAREALDVCIGFELLAQAAAQRGLADHPEVLAARRRESARTFIDEVFAAGFADPADVPHEHLEEIWPRAKRRFDHPEHRFTVYVRAPVAAPGTGDEGGRRNESDDDEVRAQQDRDARALAQEIHHGLRDHTNLGEERFVTLAREIAGERELHRGEPFDFPRAGRADEAFAEAAFAIPEPGMVSEPTRTPWGWDIILLTRIEPETRKTFEEALPELRELMFEPSRRRAFLEWADGLRAKVQVKVDADRVSELVEPSHPLGAAP